MQTLLYNIGQVLGITIIHSLWQGLTVYFLLRLWFLCRPSLSAVKKYRLAFLALLVIAFSFTYTFYTGAQAYNWHPMVTTGSSPIITSIDVPAKPLSLGAYKADLLNLPVQHASFETYKTTLYYTLKNYLPYLSVLYAIGLIINLGRLGLAWNKIRVIKQSLLAARQLQQLVDGFSKQLNIQKYVQVSFSRLIDVPCVIGYFKPILLLPITLTTQLSAVEVEAIFLHELSHIKNNDYLLNLVQQLITVLLFFNPFAQLINNAISRERENRCDDMVVRLTGKPLTYANALLKLEESRLVDLKLALAAIGTKYQLFSRIERITKTKKPIGNIRHLVLAVVLFTGCLIFCFSFKTSTTTAFTFSGKITGNPDAYVSLRYTNDQEKLVEEHCSLKNGSFSFKGDINGARLVFLTVYQDASELKKKNNQNTTSFFIEPGNITAKASYVHLKDIKINGSKAQEEYQNYQSKFATIIKASDPLINSYQRIYHEYTIAKKQHMGDEVLDYLNIKLQFINKQLIPFRSAYAKTDNEYITKHPNSYISALELLASKCGLSPDTIKKIYNGFSMAVKNSSYGKEIQRSILTLDNNAAGKKAKDFTAMDLNGKPLSLAAFKGRYVLLDFWTSIQPKLHNAPHLKQLFNKYNKAGLDVISVADDDADPYAWKHAIKNDGTGIWHHILRGLKFDKNNIDLSNSIDDKFDVSACPTKILIDENGIIIGRYVGTEENAALDKKLAEIFEHSNNRPYKVNIKLASNQKTEKPLITINLK